MIALDLHKDPMRGRLSLCPHFFTLEGYTSESLAPAQTACKVAIKTFYYGLQKFGDYFYASLRS